VGGDKGEGEMRSPRNDTRLFTPTLTLPHQGGGVSGVVGGGEGGFARSAVNVEEKGVKLRAESRLLIALLIVHAKRLSSCRSG
jgi:hypothetical protein